VAAYADPSASEQFIRPALLQEPVLACAERSPRRGLVVRGRGEGQRVRCLTCERRCEISPGGLGWCRTRRNQEGRLVTLTYGAVASLSANPIEKKPLYHFYPGTLALTSGAWSCNFDCPWCQNAGISKVPSGPAQYMSPTTFVGKAVDLGCQGTSISLNEPTLSLEWSLEVFRLARARGLYNTYVSNGYMTSQALRLLVDAGLDAMNVDVKGDAQAVRQHCGADVEKVWRNCGLALEAGVWLEITTLVVPGVNDGDEALGSIAKRIGASLGRQVPWHVSGYYPAYRFDAPPTPLRSLERAWEIGRRAGLEFVYLGNVPGHRWENTYCPECGVMLVERRGLRLAHYRLESRRPGQALCPDCGAGIAGCFG
jgi:pyruvate formate lyase activating enzyme